MIWISGVQGEFQVVAFFTWIRISESRMRNLSLFLSSAVTIVTRKVL